MQTNTPRGSRTPASGVKGRRAHRYTMGAGTFEFSSRAPVGLGDAYGQPAVDQQRGARDVARGLRAEERRGGAHVLGLAEPAGGDRVARRRVGLLPRAAGAEDALRRD